MCIRDSDKGINIFGQSASFQRTTDRVLKENSSLVPNSPDWYQEYLTYEETTEEALMKWESEESELLTSTKSEVGCVAEFEGFAVVVTGYWNEKSDDKDTSEPATYPQGMENAESGSL